MPGILTIHYLLVGASAGACLITFEIGLEQVMPSVLRRMYQVNAVALGATLVIRNNAYQQMAAGYGLAFGDDVVWTVLLIVVLRELWWLRSCEKEASHADMDA